jgi:Transposase IS4
VFGLLNNWNPQWGTLHSKIVKAYTDIQDNGRVLCSVWQDSNKVGFLSTVHDGTEWIVRNRKKTKTTSTQAAITKEPFAIFNPPPGCKDSFEHSRLLPIPGQIDDYNHHMGGVDIADQLRAKFANWPRGVKPWKPLFYWLLGTSMTNAYILWNYERKARLGLAKDKLHSGHWAFYESVIQALLVEPPPEPTAGPRPKPRPTFRPTYKSLPQARLTRPIEIHKRVRRTGTNCFFCKYLEGQKKKAQEVQITFNMPNIRRSYYTKYSCSHCNIALCINCFDKFHYYIV